MRKIIVEVVSRREVLGGIMSKLTSLEILGGGPAGLYTATLIRRYLPGVRVRVTEHNLEGATFGFGVVF